MVVTTSFFCRRCTSGWSQEEDLHLIRVKPVCKFCRHKAWVRRTDIALQALEIVGEYNLHNTTPGHNKVYHLQILRTGEGYIVLTQYGRLGSPLVYDTKTPYPLTAKEALRIAEQVSREKMSKGYTKISASPLITL